MRIIFVLLITALSGGCDVESDPQRKAGKQPAAPVASAPPPPTGTVPIQAVASMMAIPSDPEALKRLEAMGYTIHKEQAHLHAPGVKGCPAMATGPLM